jgi:hypothetical protein
LATLIGCGSTRAHVLGPPTTFIPHFTPSSLLTSTESDQYGDTMRIQVHKLLPCLTTIKKLEVFLEIKIHVRLHSCELVSYTEFRR